ncbi:PREDICTED: putative zinc finger protein 840-like [Elephantulus edwardii]|uniref:putative zinc finger protein 840-like n=1 Tax=Elephantulus edwardii TaxID=28737 RepID=UPI0003F0A124|nr:PREDICTED: putative zinc finger protein 840-like [Elephantulus edwardii]
MLSLPYIRQLCKHGRPRVDSLRSEILLPEADRNSLSVRLQNGCPSPATHAGEKPHKCSQCRQSSRYTSTFTLGRNPVCTPVVEKVSFRKEISILHKQTHTGEKSYVCADHGEAFLRKTDFTRHQHTPIWETSFVCAKCQGLSGAS